MLRTMFWSGLKPALKDASGYIYERIRDFDQLRVAVRRLEDDWKSPQPEKIPCKDVIPAKAATVVAISENSEIKELKGMIQQLAAKVKEIKMDHHGNQPERHQNSHGYGHQGRGRQSDFSSRGGRGRNSQQQPRHSSQDEDGQQDNGHFEEPTCYRCGQQGHVRLGCRVKLPQALNSNRPASRGRR